MRKLWLLVLTLFLAVGLHAKASRADDFTQCYQGPVDVEVNLDYVAPQEDVTQTAVQIDAAMRNDANSSLAADRRGVYVGVTKSTLQMHYDFAFGNRVNAARNAACPFVQKATYTFIYHPEVYIASDFLRMACRYGVTVMHEQRHVDAFLQTVNEYMPQMKQELDDYIAHMPQKQPVTAKEAIDDRHQEIMNEVTASLNPLLGQFDEINHQRQAAIDTPENYAHDDAICPDEKPAFPGR
jgi:hypothetical protein